jgi:hypothetical protein
MLGRLRQPTSGMMTRHNSATNDDVDAPLRGHLSVCSNPPGDEITTVILRTWGGVKMQGCCFAPGLSLESRRAKT